jgi:hypothetical protein
MRLEREITGIQRWLGELSVLKHRFALVDDVKVLEQQLLAAKDAHDELAGAWPSRGSSAPKTWTSACATWKNA